MVGYHELPPVARDKLTECFLFCFQSVADCILFYYQTKKKEHYKQLARRHNLKKRRRDQVFSPTHSTHARDLYHARACDYSNVSQTA